MIAILYPHILYPQSSVLGLRFPMLSAILLGRKRHPAARLCAVYGFVNGDTRRGGGQWKASADSVEQPTTIVGHLTPDLDCLTAIWILIRFGGATNADLQFFPAGTTID